MLASRFTLFYSTPPSTRLTRCKELEDFNLILDTLRVQETQLKKAASGKPASNLSFRKHIITAHLLSEIEKKITEFNAEDEAIEADKIKNQTSIINFVKEVAQIIKFTRNRFDHTLKQPRNGSKMAARDAVSSLLYGGAIVGGVFTASPLVACGGLLIANKIEDKTLQLTGLDNQTTASIRILAELSDTLTKIGLNLGLAVHWNNNIRIEEFPEEFNCLITQAELIDPVICTLDGITYEREAITKWLNKHGSSPYNRKVMRDDQRIEEMLIPNRALASYIERFRSEHPELCDAAYPSPSFSNGGK
jgi:hypothetical protein